MRELILTVTVCLVLVSYEKARDTFQCVTAAVYDRRYNLSYSLEIARRAYFFSGSNVPLPAMHSHFPLRSIHVSTQP